MRVNTKPLLDHISHQSDGEGKPRQPNKAYQGRYFGLLSLVKAHWKDLAHLSQALMAHKTGGVLMSGSELLVSAWIPVTQLGLIETPLQLAPKSWL